MSDYQIKHLLHENDALRKERDVLTAENARLRAALKATRRQATPDEIASGVAFNLRGQLARKRGWTGGDAMDKYLTDEDHEAAREAYAQAWIKAKNANADPNA